jgi:hypothetical protein
VVNGRQIEKNASSHLCSNNAQKIPSVDKTVDKELGWAEHLNFPNALNPSSSTAVFGSPPRFTGSR